MNLPRFSLVLLPLLLAAVPARAQDDGPPPFPGIAWGVSADSVIRALGEPFERKGISRGLDELNYVETEGRVFLRYILVHPSLGTVIAGTSTPFESNAECHEAFKDALDTVGRVFPRLVWAAGAQPQADAICDAAARIGEQGLDPESGTRVSVRLNGAGTALVLDAISPAGFKWIGGGG